MTHFLWKLMKLINSMVLSDLCIFYSNTQLYRVSVHCYNPFWFSALKQSTVRKPAISDSFSIMILSGCFISWHFAHEFTFHYSPALVGKVLAYFEHVYGPLYGALHLLLYDAICVYLSFTQMVSLKLCDTVHWTEVFASRYVLIYKQSSVDGRE